MASRPLFFLAPQGDSRNICKTLSPTRLNEAGNDENTYENNYTKHSFRNTTGEIPEGLIDLKCEIPLFIRKSAEFLCVLWSCVSVLPINQDRIWPKICLV